MTKVYTVMEGRYETVREPYPDDSWDNGDDRYNLSDIHVYTNGSYSEFEVEAGVGEKVHVVYVSYGTGNTFGTTSSEVEILDVFDRLEDAEALVSAVHRFNDGDSQGRIREYSFEHNGKTYYANWVGYFENFEDIDIIHAAIQRA